jgi:Rab GDP dissociation inhibitor
MRAVYEKFGLDANTQDFAGHAMALQADDEYLNKPALPTLRAIKLYAYSLERWGKSPYIYPVYGLGGLPEGFSRLCAIHGGTFILNTPIHSIEYDESGNVAGVVAELEGKTVAAKAPIIVGDPSYFKGHSASNNAGAGKEEEGGSGGGGDDAAAATAAQVTKTGQVVRSICVLAHPIAAIAGNDSAQIIIPQNQCGRKHDIYVSVLSSKHMVCPRGKTIAIVSTTVETATPEKELAPAFALLGEIQQRFTAVADTYVPAAGLSAKKVFVTSSYDASSHFEETTEDVLAVYEALMGEPLDLDTMTTEITEP